MDNNYYRLLETASKLEMKAMVALKRTPIGPTGQLLVSRLPEAYQHCTPPF